MKIKMSKFHKKLEIKNGKYTFTITLDPQLSKARLFRNEGYIEIEVGGSSHMIVLSKEDLSELANFLKPYDVAVMDGGIDV
jgi:hypothetical protein